MRETQHTPPPPLCPLCSRPYAPPPFLVYSRTIADGGPNPQSTIPQLVFRRRTPLTTELKTHFAAARVPRDRTRGPCCQRGDTTGTHKRTKSNEAYVWIDA